MRIHRPRQNSQAGDIDVWVENNPQRWLSGFDFPAARDGRITKLTVPLGTPSGLRGFVLNTRRPLLVDRSLRQALDLMFDFQWVNRVLFGGTYKRTESYFGNTALSATGNEADPVEMQLLADSLIEPEILIAG
ncbi:MAG: ABC transporter substrate-binding protein, partial [Rhodobiaceae bacterium]